jgi:MSHA biogenesis protein MshN
VSANDKALESAVSSIPKTTAPALAQVATPVPKSEPAPRKAEPAREAAKSETPEPADSPVRISVDRTPRAVSGPARATAEYRRANDLLSQGRVDGALGAYTEALRADPRHVAARQALVVVLLDRGRGDEAVAALREGIEVVPQNSAWPMLLARLQVDAHDVKGASTTLERSLASGGGDSEYRSFLATLLQMQSRHGEAIQHYQAAVQIDPSSGRSFTGLAISLEAEKRLPEAREAYRRALATNTLGRDLESFAQERLKQIQ